MRRYGDPNYVTPETRRRELSRAAQPTLGKAKSTSYLKLFGRHAHRRVMEEHLGRPLKRSEIVHHIDGDRHNNSIENLQLMTQSDHIKLHSDELQSARKIKTHCRNGHEKSIRNPGTPSEKRYCKVCMRLAYEKHRAKKCRSDLIK
jgi:hypothetical protein